MRVTTNILNDSARRAGLPLQQTSLLDYVNKNDSGSSLFDSIGSTKTTADKYADYSKLEKAAESLSETVEKWSAEGEKSPYASTETLKSLAKQTASAFNDTVTALKFGGTTLEKYYAEMLGEAVTENTDAYKSIGVSVDKNGKLAIDAEKLTTAPAETVENLMRPLGEKISFVAGSASDFARTNASSVLSQYTAGGGFTEASGSTHSWWS